MAQDDKLHKTGTFKMPKDGGSPVPAGNPPPPPLTANPITGATITAADSKLAEGARLDELDRDEIALIEARAWREDEKRILEARKLEAGPSKPLIEKNYGVFGDSIQVFRILHEQVGPFNRYEHKVIPIRDLVEFDVVGSHKNGFEPDYSKPLIGKTHDKINYLVSIGAIAPLASLKSA